ncbi:MAG TPA: hypothetical protein DDY59_07975 [Lachnospiraceae bacterium]|nr:hypothetical protein [Lachnospiraceae bacterium]
MKVYIAISKIVSSNTIGLLQETGFEVDYNKNGNELPPEQLSNLIKDADGVLAGTEYYTSEVLSKCSKLKCISRIGESSKNIDLDYSKKNGIVIATVSPDIRAKYVAEMTVAALFSLYYDITSKHKLKTKSIRNSTILIIGYNQLSLRIIDLLECFNVNVKIFDKGKDVPFKYYCSIRKEIVRSEAIIITSKIKDVLHDVNVFDDVKKGIIILDVPGNSQISENISKIMARGALSTYWTTSENESLTAASGNGMLTPYSNFQSTQFLEEFEEIAVTNLISILKSD